jgi:hypothetical protein
MDSDADTPRTGGRQVTVTPGQLAAARGVSERTVRRWITKGALPSGMTAEQTPDGWRIAVPDARALDCQTLNDVTGQVPDAVSQELRARIGALEADLAAAREREAWLRQRVEKAEADRAELVARVPLALPAAPEERGWWRRLFGGSRGGDRVGR